MADIQPAHLSDLFRTGELVTVEDADGNGYPIYVMRPSGLQQEEAREHANAKVARHKLQTKDKDSDLYVSMRMAIDENSYDGAIESLVRFDEVEIRENALNVVMFSEESEWKDDRYMNVLQAMTARMGDIEKYNDEMEEGGVEDRIDPETDPQLQDIMAEYEAFQKEVKDIEDTDKAEKEAEYKAMPEGKMRDLLLEKSFDLDVRMQWYETYQLRMLGYACRYPDDHKKMYFASVDDVHELPMYVRTQLFTAYEAIEKGSDEVKNSLSLLNS